MKHRGSDPEAIQVADNLGLLFDEVQTGYDVGYPGLSLDDFYQFTIASGKGKGITFYVRELSQAESRRDEKLREFELKE